MIETVNGCALRCGYVSALMALIGEMMKNELNAFAKRTRIDSKADIIQPEGLRIRLILLFCLPIVSLSCLSLVVMK